MVIFWGSQSGKAERLAKSLARQCKKRYRIKATVGDLDDFDHHHLEDVPNNKYVVFIVSTFGEGDPPDNAAGLDEYLAKLRTGDTNAVETNRLCNLQYFAFGLGSRKYHHFNRFVDVVDETLSAAGAHPLGFVGKADDSMPSDDAWSTWTGSVLTELTTRLGGDSQASSIAAEYEPELQLVERPGSSTGVVQSHLVSGRGQNQPIATKISKMEFLSRSEHYDQQSLSPDYLHVEFDIRGTAALKYHVGDHVALLPMNSEDEVQRLTTLFGWNDQILTAVVDVKPRSNDDDEEDISTTLSVPTPTTRQALLRHYLDISGPITLEVTRLLAHYAPIQVAKDFLTSLASPTDGKLAIDVGARFLTVGMLMELAHPVQTGNVWPEQLFECLIHTLPRLQPRYFSIASSPTIEPNLLAITVSVLVNPYNSDSQEKRFYGLATNYLYAHSEAVVSGTKDPIGSSSLTADRPRFAFEDEKKPGKVFLRIRPSTFKLPNDQQTPIIMIAVGSGIAPFRAFIHERVEGATKGQKVGKMLLFFGIRTKRVDFLYGDEWHQIQSRLENAGQSDIFTLHTAVSRPSASAEKKKYVQDVVLEEKAHVMSLLQEDKASLYICGSVKLSVGVTGVIKQLLESEYSWDPSRCEQYINDLKASGRWKEDVWT